MIVLDRDTMIMVNIVTLIILVLVNILRVALNIEILGIVTVELILCNLHRHILLLDPLANHLSIPDLTNKHIIIFMETIYMIFILIAGIMMILCLLAIQWKNNYISRYL